MVHFRDSFKHKWNRLAKKDQLARNNQFSHDSATASTAATAAAPTSTPQSLWDQAYCALKAKDPKTVGEYEQLLSVELVGQDSHAGSKQPDTSTQRSQGLDCTNNQIKNSDPSLHQLQLERVIKLGLRRVDEKKTTYHIWGHEFILQDQIARTAKFLEWASDWIGDAVQASPQASVAWAAVCITLPLLTKPAVAEQANRDGFTYVTTRMRYYVALESLLLPQSKDPRTNPLPTSLELELQGHVLDLYQHILDFQVRSVLRFYRSSSKNFGRDVVQKDDWNKMRNVIEDLERIVYHDSQQIGTLTANQNLGNLASDAGATLSTVLKLLSTAEEQLRVIEQHRDISNKQLSIGIEQLHVQEVIAKKMTSQEQECHQLFRLVNDEKQEGSYEWYKNRVDDRVEGTCEWLLEHQNYSAWKNQTSGPLLITADPGCGKSVLAKYLIDSHFSRTNSAVCYFFFKDQDQNTFRQALCALLHQLFTQKPNLLRHALPEYLANGKSLVNVTNSLERILANVAHDVEVGQIIFVLDALDECTRSDLQQLLRMIEHQFSTGSSGIGKVKYLLTSRPYEQIMSGFTRLMDSFPSIRIPGEEASSRIGEEVNRVIVFRLKRLAKEKNLDVSIKHHLQQCLTRVPNRTYLWVHLVFDYLESRVLKKTPKGIEDSIAKLPETVNQAYEQILSKAEDQQIVRKVLCIILAASRPLSLKEMNIAVNVEDSLTTLDDLDLEDETTFQDTLRSWCGLFVSVYNNRVYLLHQTAREFLMGELLQASSRPSGWHGSIQAHEAHLVLAHICIKCLLLHRIEFNGTDPGVSRTLEELDSKRKLKVKADEEIEVNSNTDTESDPSYDDGLYVDFLYYSREEWGVHFSQIKQSEDAPIVPLALQLCDP
ncbi:MAG: hypothetical protein LQ340_004584, partial [Diploschistes diacapsis]